MDSGFEALPVELVEMIVVRLALDDIKALRHTSRTLEKKASRGYFTTFFVNHHIELTKEDLQNLIRVTGQGRAGLHLRKCTITGIACHDSKGKEPNVEDIHMLTQAFENLKQYSPEGAIASISLDIAVDDKSSAKLHHCEAHKSNPGIARCWRTIFDTAAATFKVVASALLSSELPVYEHLDIFSSIKGCSLYSDVFHAFAQEFAAAPNILQSLKKLSVSLSAPVGRTMLDVSMELDEDEDDARIHGRRNQTNHSRITLLRLPRLIQTMSMLESFDLHWQSVEDTSTAISVPSMADLNNGGTIWSSPTRLQQCALRGVWTSADDLLDLLRFLNPSSLTLIYVHLIPESTWKEVFEYVTNVTSSLTEYHFDDLMTSITFDEGRVSYKLVHYDGVPGRSKFRYLNEVMGPSTIKRSSTDGNKPIEYRIPSRRRLGSGAVLSWDLEVQKQFGSSHYFRYNFLTLNAPPRIYDTSDNDR